MVLTCFALEQGARVDNDVLGCVLSCWQEDVCLHVEEISEENECGRLSQLHDDMFGLAKSVRFITRNPYFSRHSGYDKCVCACEKGP